MKKKIIIISAAVILLTALITAAAIKLSAPEPDSGTKSFTVVISYSGGRSESISITTDKKYMAEALLEKDIITQEEFDAQNGYTQINGAFADYEIDAAWWCLTEQGDTEQLDFDTLQPQSGRTYEIAYTIG